MFNRLEHKKNRVNGELRDCYFWTSTRVFDPLFEFPKNVIGRVFDFSYGMTFGQEGEHREYRSGGTHKRENGELFINTFQGKLTEFGLHQTLNEQGIETSEPDLSKWEKGKWDTVDLMVDNTKLNVKSTKFKGNLLLLETKDWDKDGGYIPNKESGDNYYDFFILTRVSPDGESLMKKQRLYYSNTIHKGRVYLRKLILGEKWKIDIAGFVTQDDIVYVINNDYILPQGSYLNRFTRMDAENYYVQSGDMKKMDELIKILKS
jgi:hypothetical protein|tara:strand:- start:1505 stop:2290 length:786 start_codon:yes stop_codon:yes gene_type:complete